MAISITEYSDTVTIASSTNGNFDTDSITTNNGDLVVVYVGGAWHGAGGQYFTVTGLSLSWANELNNNLWGGRRVDHIVSSVSDGTDGVINIAYVNNATTLQDVHWIIYVISGVDTTTNNGIVQDIHAESAGDPPSDLDLASGITSGNAVINVMSLENDEAMTPYDNWAGATEAPSPELALSGSYGYRRFGAAYDTTDPPQTNIQWNWATGANWSSWAAEIAAASTGVTANTSAASSTFSAQTTSTTKGTVTKTTTAASANFTAQTTSIEVGATTISTSASSATFSGAVTTAENSPGFSDPFNGATLAPFWTEVDPVGDIGGNTGGTVSVSGGLLYLAVPSGDSKNYDNWPDDTPVNRSLRITQPVSTGNWVMETKILNTDIQTNRFAGFLIEADSDNFIRIDWDGDGTNVDLFIGIWSGGPSFTVEFNSPVGNDAAQWLRVKKSGTTYTILTSLNGSTWTQRDQFTWTPTPTKVGLNAGSSSTSVSYTAQFEYFSIVPYFIDTNAASASFTAAVTSLSGSSALPTFTFKDGSSDTLNGTTADSTVTPSVSIGGDKLVLVAAIVAQAATNTSPTGTISGLSLTWTAVWDVEFSGRRRFIIWRAYADSATSGAITFNWTSDAATTLQDAVWSVYEVSNVDGTTNNGVVQIATSPSPASTVRYASGSVTLTSPTVGNAIFTLLALEEGLGATTVTDDTNFTFVGTTQTSSNTRKLYRGLYDNSEPLDATPSLSWTPNSAFAMAALEIQAGTSSTITITTNAASASYSGAVITINTGAVSKTTEVASATFTAQIITANIGQTIVNTSAAFITYTATKTNTFNANNYNNCAIWLDSNDLSYTLINGDLVSNWTNKAINGKGNLVQSNDSEKPTFRSAPSGFNNNPAVEFAVPPNTYGRLETVTPTSFTGGANLKLTAFIVLESDLPGTGVNSILTKTNVTDPRPFDLYTTSPGAGRLIVDTSPLVGITETSNSIANTTYIYEFFADATASPSRYYIFRNGVQTAQGINLGTPNSDSTSISIKLGYRNLSSTIFDGHIAEVLLFENALDTNKRQEIRSYLANKYDISVITSVPSFGASSAFTAQPTTAEVGAVIISTTNSSASFAAQTTSATSGNTVISTSAASATFSAQPSKHLMPAVSSFQANPTWISPFILTRIAVNQRNNTTTSHAITVPQAKAPPDGSLIVVVVNAARSSGSPVVIFQNPSISIPGMSFATPQMLQQGTQYNTSSLQTRSVIWWTTASGTATGPGTITTNTTDWCISFSAAYYVPGGYSGYPVEYKNDIDGLTAYWTPDPWDVDGISLGIMLAHNLLGETVTQINPKWNTSVYPPYYTQPIELDQTDLTWEANQRLMAQIQYTHRNMYGFTWDVEATNTPKLGNYIVLIRRGLQINTSVASATFTAQETTVSIDQTTTTSAASAAFSAGVPEPITTYIWESNIPWDADYVTWDGDAVSAIATSPASASFQAQPTSTVVPPTVATTSVAQATFSAQATTITVGVVTVNTTATSATFSAQATTATTGARTVTTSAASATFSASNTSTNQGVKTSAASATFSAQETTATTGLTIANTSAASATFSAQPTTITGSVTVTTSATTAIFTAQATSSVVSATTKTTLAASATFTAQPSSTESKVERKTSAATATFSAQPTSYTSGLITTTTSSATATFTAQITSIYTRKTITTSAATATFSAIATSHTVGTSYRTTAPATATFVAQPSSTEGKIERKTAAASADFSAQPTSYTPGAIFATTSIATATFTAGATSYTVGLTTKTTAPATATFSAQPLQVAVGSGTVFTGAATATFAAQPTTISSGSISATTSTATAVFTAGATSFSAGSVTSTTSPATATFAATATTFAAGVVVTTTTATSAQFAAQSTSHIAGHSYRTTGACSAAFTAQPSSTEGKIERKTNAASATFSAAPTSIIVENIAVYTSASAATFSAQQTTTVLSTVITTSFAAANFSAQTTSRTVGATTKTTSPASASFVAEPTSTAGKVERKTAAASASFAAESTTSTPGPVSIATSVASFIASAGESSHVAGLSTKTTSPSTASFTAGQTGFTPGATSVQTSVATFIATASATNNARTTSTATASAQFTAQPTSHLSGLTTKTTTPATATFRAARTNNTLIAPNIFYRNWIID